jgi:WD40 repeat protein
VRLLPYDTFTLQTPDALAIVLQRLAAYIEPEKPIRWHFSRNHLPYEGTVSETGFQIRRIIHHRNSFLPRIQGRFDTSPLGTSVHITMSLHPFVIGFLILWYLIWYGFFFPFWLVGNMPVGFALQFLGLPVVILFAFWMAFWSEAYRSRRDLTQMISGYPSNSSSHTARSWIPNAMQWGIFLLGLVMVFLQITGTFRPSTSSESVPSSTAACSQQLNHSPICKMSVVRTINGHPAASALAISTDGKTLVSGGNDKAIKIWDLKTGYLKKTLQSDSGQIRALAIAPDGKTVVSGSADHMVRIWDLTSDRPPRMLVGHPEEVEQVAITPDGKTVISGSYGAIKQWDLATGQLKATFPKVAESKTTIGPIAIIHDEAGQFNPLDINSASRTALISDLKLVNLASNEAKTIPTRQVENWMADYFLSAHMSPDGKLAALQYGNTFRKFETRLKVWNLTTGELQAEESATFSHNTFEDIPLTLSRDFIFGSTGQQLKVWNLRTLQLEAILEAKWMHSLVVTPDGKQLAGLTSDWDSGHTQINVWRSP